MTGQYQQNNINNPRGSQTVTENSDLTLDADLVVADTSLNPVILNLPNADQIPGNTIYIKAPTGGSNPVTLIGANGQTIDGSPSIVLDTNKASAVLRSDGSNWELFLGGGGRYGYDVEADTVPNLQAMTDTTVSAGDRGLVLSSGNAYVCTAATAVRSTWRPSDNVWRTQDYAATTTAQIQVIINDASSVTNGIVELGPGIFSVNATLTLPANFFTLRGLGRRDSLLRATGFAGVVIKTSPAGFNPSPTSSNIRIHDLGIDHPTGGNPGLAGINIVNSARCIVERVDVRLMAEYGIRIGDESHFCVVRDSYFASASPAGVLFAGARSCWAEGCSIRGSDVGVLFKGTVDAGNSNSGVLYGGIEGWDPVAGAAIEFDSLLGLTFNALVQGVRLEEPGATVAIRVGPGTVAVASTWNHFVGATNRVLDSGIDTTFFAQGGQTPVQLTNEASGVRLAQVRSGTGSPEGVVIGDPGDQWNRTDTAGGPGTSLYIKESGIGTDTGWIAK